MNDILIPYLKGAFELSYFQANLVQFAFFSAYFIGSLIYFLVSLKIGDPIQKIGYKNGIILGLIIASIGGFLFYPAAGYASFPFFLSALFVLGLGFTMLQISANPYVAILGDPATASSRLNLSQGFNSLGTTFAPLIGGYLIFSYFNDSTNTTEAVKTPYLIFAAALMLIALLIYVTKLPVVISQKKSISERSVLKFKHLNLGMIAIFMYVGGEVAIGSNLISYLSLDNIAGLDEASASTFLAFYWGGLMIGRFLGAISLSKISNPAKKYCFMFISAIVTMIILYIAINIKENDFEAINFAYFAILVVLSFLAFILGQSVSNRTLLIFSLFVIGLLLAGVFTNGKPAMWCLLGIGLFNSIMWSNIFTLAIDKLEDYTSQGSSLLVTAIIGGAVFPPLQGLLADNIGVQNSFLLPIIAYFYLAYYGWKGYKPTIINT